MTIAILPSLSDTTRRRPRALPTVLIGNPGNRRTAFFQSALTGVNLPPATVVSYRDLVRGIARLEDYVAADSLVRIDSPGQDFEVERLLLQAGADAAAEEGCPHLSARQVQDLEFDRGRILYPRQWYLGFQKVLREIDRRLEHCPRHHGFHDASEIELMFDKPRCQARLDRAGIPVPMSLGPVQNYEQLRTKMATLDCSRVFVKLAHGSSGSGAVALQLNRRQPVAISTVELLRKTGEIRLYNSRKIRSYTRENDIAAIIDALCLEGVQVEQWLPKACLASGPFDLRIVVIANQARHWVVRSSQSPFTNLHLGNARGNPHALLQRMDSAAWQTAREICQRAAAVLPGSLYMGIDLLIRPGFHHHDVLELNAFGDLLPGILEEGRDTYMAEVAALLERLETAETGDSSP